MLKPRLSTLPDRLSPPARPRRPGTAEKRLSGRRLQRIRARILARDPICVHCLKQDPPRVSASTEVDHIVPLSKGGDYSDENLAGLCHDCHAEKSARERGAKPKRRIGPDGIPTDGSWK